VKHLFFQKLPGSENANDVTSFVIGLKRTKACSRPRQTPTSICGLRHQKKSKKDGGSAAPTGQKTF
jgi:hypothetical protein